VPSWTTVPAWIAGEILTKLKLDKAPTAIGELQTWATADDARIATLESFVGTGATRPQLRVYAPASITVSSIVPYASVRKDTHSGWNGGTYRYTVPVAGLYAAAVSYKCSATAAAPSQYLAVNGTSVLSGPNAVSASYVGSHVTGMLDLAVSDVVDVREQSASYTPQNDSTGSQGTGSNFLHLTYIGPTT
jgi:hypothetical protein